MNTIEEKQKFREQDLQYRFAYLFPTVRFDIIPEVAVTMGYVSLLVDALKEELCLQEVRHNFRLGHQFAKRIDFPLVDHVHIDPYVEKVEPTAYLLTSLPALVHRLIKPGEEVGRVGKRHLDRQYTFFIIGLAQDHLPRAVIWYNWRLPSLRQAHTVAASHTFFGEHAAIDYATQGRTREA